jgi:hypothetical protein
MLAQTYVEAYYSVMPASEAFPTGVETSKSTLSPQEDLLNSFGEETTWMLELMPATGRVADMLTADFFLMKENLKESLASYSRR